MNKNSALTKAKSKSNSHSHLTIKDSQTKTGFLYLIVVISGSAVMILELLGTRIIAPYYGVSLYVWSSLIAVTLIALALGYYLGGYCADRFSRIRLHHVVLIAAVATVLIPFISGPVLNISNPLGIRGGAFISAFVLFTLPLTALAMVGPYIIKMATHDLKGVGTAAGSVYAVSTVGSVLGTLILGFYLLPHFGTRAIIFSLSFILLALTALLVFIDTDNNKGPNSVMPLIVVGLFTAALSINGFAKINDNVKGFKVLHEEESIYGWVRVVDDLKNGFRLLLSDASVLSAFEISTARSLLSYQWVLGALPQFRPEAKQALLIGLGGGHVAKDLKSKGIPTDTIEIDPAVAKASIDYFNFQPTGDFIVGDARYEIKKINKKYDFIIHDCFTGGTEPTHLLTVEMLNELRGLLTNQGILALNYVGFTKGEGSNAVKSVFNTLSKVLPNIRIFITEKEEFTDFIFLASSQALNLDSNSTDRRVQWLLDHEFSFNDLTGAITITDDFNPLESMQVRKSEYYRKLFMERIDSDLLLIL